MLSAEDYQHKHSKWVADVRNFFSHLHKNKVINRIFITTLFTLQNIGSTPAERVRLTIRTEPGWFILPKPPKGLPSPWKFNFQLCPPPPTPYILRPTHPLSPFRDGPLPFLNNTYHNDRDKNTFYYSPEKPTQPGRALEFSCDEFLHKIYSKKFSIDIMSSARLDNNKTTINISFYAKNLPDIVSEKSKITIKHTRANISDIAQKIVEKSIAQHREQKIRRY